MNSPTLTLAIPTYNRRPKLQRLLNQVAEQTEKLAGFPRLQVLVSNNCSTDGTRDFLDNLKAQSFDLRVIHQPVNVGGCRNTERLHRESVTDYTWLFSDDDLLLPDAIVHVWTALRDYAPDLLRFSFIQPVGNKIPTFNFPKPVYVTNDHEEIATLIAHNWKISSYVHKNVVLPPNEPIFHYAYGYGWIWLGWAYAVVAANPNPKLCVISHPLASCDEEETNDGTRFGRTVWAEMEHVFRHPFVLNHAPHLYDYWRDWGYQYWVNSAFDMKSGKLPKEFFDYGRNDMRPPFRFGSLLRGRRLLCRWACVRINSPVVLRFYNYLEAGEGAIRKRLRPVRQFLKGP